MGAEMSIPLLLLGLHLVLPVAIGVGIVLLLEPDEADMRNIQRESCYISDYNAWREGRRMAEPRRSDYRW